MIWKKISLIVISFLNELELICLHTNITIVSTVKWLQLDSILICLETEVVTSFSI